MKNSGRLEIEIVDVDLEQDVRDGLPDLRIEDPGFGAGAVIENRITEESRQFYLGLLGFIARIAYE